MSEIGSQRIKGHPLLGRKWYYSIEVAPGVYTDGANWPNIALTRMALRAADVAGRRCIDIGTQEGLVPILLARRGAAYVAGQDVIDRSERIAFLQRALGVQFDYFGGVRLGDLREAIETGAPGAFPFDVVVFSGVLYHMSDPFGGLARVRGLVADGGLVIVETVASADDSMALHFNAAGMYMPNNGSFFVISVPCLDYMLRFFHLQPLDCLFSGRRDRGGLPIGRVCVVCRALAEGPGPDDDAWMRANLRGFSSGVWFDETIRWGELAGGRPPVPYAPINEQRVLRKATGDVDVLQTVTQGKPINLPGSDLIRLPLNTVY